MERRCENTISTQWSNADNVCNDILSYMSAMTGGVNNYDASIFAGDSPSIY